MKFTYSLISDMHVNHPQLKTPYELLEHNVIVAGDTSNGLDGLKFLHKLQNKGHRVFATLGNHEHYLNMSKGRDLDATRFRFEDVFSPRIDVDDVLSVVLVTGWYQISAPAMWFNYMNDGRYCADPVDPAMAAFLITQAAKGDCEALRGYLSDANRKYIVVTHTAPCLETLNPAFKDDFTNEWYWNPELGDILREFSDRILIWNHGHSHASMDEIVDGIRVVCNPRGYPRENPNWKPKTITVEY